MPNLRSPTLPHTASSFIYDKTSDDWRAIESSDLIGGGAKDAFGRLRVSEPFTLADYHHVYGEDSDVLYKISGVGASVTNNTKQAKTILTLGTGSGSYAIHQSRKYHHYLPGKSQQVFESFNFTAPNSGTVKRVGYYDDLNGVYLQQSGDGSLQIVLRSNVSGTPTERIVQQRDWNIDPCNGSGTSNFNIDQTKTQLLSTDFQWLGVGRVRLGFVHDGNLIFAHEFYHSNNLETVYWSNPSLPIRCEIRNLTNTTTSGTMDQICASVVSEGGYVEAGVDFGQRTNSRTLTSSQTLPMMAIRLMTGFRGEQNRTNVRLGGLSMLAVNENIAYDVWRLPSSTSVLGGSWVNANNDESAVEYNITPTGFISTSGERIDTGFIIGGGGAGKNSVVGDFANITSAKRAYLGQNIDSTDSNAFIIIFTNLSSSQSTAAFASMQWREIR